MLFFNDENLISITVGAFFVMSKKLISIIFALFFPSRRSDVDHLCALFVKSKKWFRSLLCSFENTHTADSLFLDHFFFNTLWRFFWVGICWCVCGMGGGGVGGRCWEVVLVCERWCVWVCVCLSLCAWLLVDM